MITVHFSKTTVIASTHIYDVISYLCFNPDADLADPVWSLLVRWTENSNSNAILCISIRSIASGLVAFCIGPYGVCPFWQGWCQHWFWQSADMTGGLTKSKWEFQFHNNVLPAWRRFQYFLCGSGHSNCMLLELWSKIWAVSSPCPRHSRAWEFPVLWLVKISGPVPVSGGCGVAFESIYAADFGGLTYLWL